MSCECSVSGCDKSAAAGKIISYHELPSSNPEMLEKWMKKIDFCETISENSRVCSLHFDDESFDKDGETWNLRSCAVPLEYKVS